MVELTRPSRSAVILTVLVLLTGCSAFSVVDQQTATSQPTVAEFSYPAGWSQSGITALSVAMETHHETVENVSRESRLVITDDDSNRTVVRTIDTETGTASIRFVDTQYNSDIHVYYSPEGVFEYDRTTGELRRKPAANWTGADVATMAGLERPLRRLELNATDTVSVEGTTAVRYTVTGIENPGSVPSNTATGHVIVAREGFIASYNVTRGNEEFTRQTRYDLSALGNATVTRPTWMPDG